MCNCLMKPIRAVTYQ